LWFLLLGTFDSSRELLAPFELPEFPFLALELALAEFRIEQRELLPSPGLARLARELRTLLSAAVSTRVFLGHFVFSFGLS